MNNVHNLKIELEIEELLLQRLEQKRKRIIERQSPKGYPGGQSYQDADSISGHGTIGFDDTLMAIDKIDEEIYETMKRIECLERDIQEIEYLVGSLSGLEHKVKYMQLVEGKSLKEIADETGYDYGYIKNISMKIKM